jgi:plastocyanin
LSHRSRAALTAALALLIVPAGASAATKTVAAGPPLTKPPPGLQNVDADGTQFFRDTTTIHVGDTMRWKFFGFHSIYFPRKGGKNAPLAIPDTTRKYSGDVDPAGQPFWFNGQTQLVGNPAAVFPRGGKVEDGSKANASGAPPGDPEKFNYKLRFAKTGTYTYYCTIHPLMKGRIKVVAKSARVPSAAADRAVVAKQLARTIAEVRSAVKRKDAAGNVVEMGRDTSRISLLGFYPATKTVPTGTTVDFRMSPSTNEIHTVTFGSDAVLAKGGFAEQLENGLLSPLPGTGQRGPPLLGFPGAIVFPSDPGPLAFDGSQHGGFLSAGLQGFKPFPRDSQITFTAPGTYNYICLVHPDMKGQIIVQ